MKSWLVVATSALALVLSVYTVLEVQGRTDEGTDVSSGDSASSRPNSKTINALQRDVRQLRMELNRLKRQLDAVNRNISVIERAGTKHQSVNALVKEENAEVLEDVVVDRVQARLEKKMDKIAARRRTPRGEWIAPMDELSEALSLDTRQAAKAQQIFDDARDQTFDLFKIEQADGGSMVDDVVSDLKSGMPQHEAWGRFMKRIFSDTIPGTEDTYLSRLIELRGSVFSDLGANLSDAQVSTLEGLKIDPLRVETGHDPIRQYVEEALAE